ncbi:putative T7SS-secreted protein [Lentzea sp. JNUCC 0626]|uniref:putative T7SS-secreted protein n=1 Tax=Lentzea sp. JNUCC 0626 TaxID=3367513 RepID=UPI00374816D1
MSSYHGISGDVAELADAGDAKDLISGAPEDITKSATAMAELGEAMTLAGRGLSAVDASSWIGKAANNFRSRMEDKPKQWLDAGTALSEIAKALTDYRVVLDASQDAASHALHMWKGAQEATKRAINEHNERVEAYNKIIDAGQNPGPQPVYKDPGQAGRDQAEQMLEDARRRVTDAGYACGQVVSEWISRSPTEPDWWDRLGANIYDSAAFVLTGAQDVAEGIWEGVKGISSVSRLLNPLDPYNMTHPGALMENANKLAQGLWRGVQNPTEFGKNLLDIETWKDSPGKALGKLLPDIALGAATGGAGLAGRTAARATLTATVDTATGGLFGLGQAGLGGARKVGTMLGHDADKLGRTAEDAARASRNTPSSVPDHPGTRPLQEAESQAVSGFEQVGKTLEGIGGDLRSRIDNLADWAASRRTDSTAVSSVTPAPQPSAHPPPQLGQSTPIPGQYQPAEPPALRPVQAPPELPRTPPSFDTPERRSYDTGQRIQRSIEDSRRFKDDMRAGFPHGNGIPSPERHPQADQHPGHAHQSEHDHDPQPEPPSRSPLAYDDNVRADIDHTAAVKTLDLSTIDKGAVWRTTTEELHRVDSRSLDELFRDGLRPRNDNLANIHDMIGNNAHSGWVSTSRNSNLWENHGIVGIGDQKTFSVLTVDARGGVDVEASWAYTHYLKEAEIAFPGGVEPSRVRGGYLVRINPDGSREIVPDSWRENPNYHP